METHARKQAAIIESDLRNFAQSISDRKTAKLLVVKIVKDLRDLGMGDDEIARRIKSCFARVSSGKSKPNSINKALREAGIRQRALRSDAGRPQLKRPSILEGIKIRPKLKIENKQSKAEDDARRLAVRAMSLMGNNKEAAIAALKAASESIEAGDYSV